MTKTINMEKCKKRIKRKNNNKKRNITQIRFFFTKLHKNEMEIFAFGVITFEPINIQTCLAPQNVCLNISFVKDVHVHSCQKKMIQSGLKTTI